MKIVVTFVGVLQVYIHWGWTIVKELKSLNDLQPFILLAINRIESLYQLPDVDKANADPEPLEFV